MPKFKVCVYKNVGRADIHLEAADATAAREQAIEEVEQGKHPFYGTDQAFVALVYEDDAKLPPTPGKKGEDGATRKT